MQDSKFIAHQVPQLNGATVRISTQDGQLWFVVKDVCDVLGISNPADTLAKALREEQKGIAKVSTSGGIQKMAIINESGLYTILASSRKRPGKVKAQIYQSLTGNEPTFIASYKEPEFVELLTDAIKGMYGYTVLTQVDFKGKYLLDIYIPAAKIFVEYDESYHKGSKQASADEERQKHIEKKLGITCVRVSEGKSHGENLGTVLKKIGEAIHRIDDEWEKRNTNPVDLWVSECKKLIPFLVESLGCDTDMCRKIAYELGSQIERDLDTEFLPTVLVRDVLEGPYASLGRNPDVDINKFLSSI